MDESQFILRLPEPLVESMRFALASTKRRDAAGEDKKPSKFGVSFQDDRNATFAVDDKEYPAYLMDLPCIVETHKTADKRTFYKSGDLHQVLVVRMPEDPVPNSPYLGDGLTSAAQGALERLAPPEKVFGDDQVELVERRIKYVIDHKTTFTEKKPANPVEEEEVVIEEETVNATPLKGGMANGKPGSAPDKPTAEKPPIPTPATLEAGKPVVSSEMTVDTPVPDTPAPSVDIQPSPGPDTPMPFTPVPFTPVPITPGPGDTPGPDEEDDAEDEEEDDDFAEMLMDSEPQNSREDEAKKRIEILKLDTKITEKKAELADLDKQIANAPNPVWRSRITAKRPDLQKALEALEKEREELRSS